MDCMSNQCVLVLLNYNRAADCIALVNQLIENISARYRIFLIDNNSEDAQSLYDYAVANCAEIIENANASSELLTSRLIYIQTGENLGYAKGNNIGLKLAKKMGYQYAYIINPDVLICDYSVFDDLIAVMNTSNRKIGLIGPKVVLPDGAVQAPMYHRPNGSFVAFNVLYPMSSIVMKIVRRFELSRYGYCDAYHVIGCFFGLDLLIWDSCGYFDENTFLYYEEAIISERLSKVGARVVYRPKVQIVHNHEYDPNWADGNAYFEKSRQYYENEYRSASPLLMLLINWTIKYQRMINVMLMKVGRIR